MPDYKNFTIANPNNRDHAERVMRFAIEVIYAKYDPKVQELMTDYGLNAGIESGILYIEKSDMKKLAMQNNQSDHFNLNIERVMNRAGSVTDDMDSFEKLEERIGVSKLKTEINNFLFQYVSSDTTVGELEQMAVELYETIESTYSK